MTIGVPPGYPQTPAANPAGNAVPGVTFGTTSYPSAAQIEQAASSLQLDLRVVYGFAAVNGFVPSTTAIGLAFQNSFQGIVNGWQSSGQLDNSVTLDTLYAYVNFNGAWPSNPAALISWAQGAGLLNSAGKQYHTAAVGQYYPPASSSWTVPSNSTSSGTTPAPSSFNIDFGAFFSTVLSNPMAAITSQPIPAAITGYVLLKFQPWKMLRGLRL